jgi:hypothetical protein
MFVKIPLWVVRERRMLRGLMAGCGQKAEFHQAHFLAPFSSQSARNGHSDTGGIREKVYFIYSATFDRAITDYPEPGQSHPQVTWVLTDNRLVNVETDRQVMTSYVALRGEE